MGTRKRYLSICKHFFLGVLTIIFMEDALAQGIDKRVNTIEYQKTDNYPSENISVTISGQLALCSHEDKGHIILDVTGGKAPYTFRWNNNETVQNRYNLFAGTYTVFITDANGKEHTEKIIIQPPFPLIVDLIEKKDATCGSSADGSAKLEVKFGRGEPYKIEWSHGLRDKWEAADLLPGTYTVTIADHFNCDTSISFEILGDGPGIEVNERIENIDCSNETGAIFLDVDGGSGNYSFEWSNGETTKDISGLYAGIYEVLVKDEKGCSSYRSFEVFSAQSDIIVEVNRIQHNLCAGAGDGEVDLEISGGVAPYSIQWNNGQKSSSIVGMTAGIYSVKVTDATGCSVNQSITIQEPEKMVARIDTSLELDCSTGDFKVQAWLKIEGGKSPYAIKWSDGSINVKEIELLNEQEVGVEVIDADGCSVLEKVRVNSFDKESSLRIDFNFRKLEINALDQVYMSEELIFESQISEEFIAWHWDFGDGQKSSDKDPIHSYNAWGDFDVTLTAYDIYGCSSVETKVVSVLDNEAWMTVPTAFTPNGDGLNDVFKPIIKGVIEFEMNIFNNWGEQIFAASGLESEGWDGFYKGKLMPRGSYVYQISFTNIQGDKLQKSGSITLIR